MVAASPDTAQHVVLGAILDAAIEDGHLVVNPAKKKRTVKVPKSSEVRAQNTEDWTQTKTTKTGSARVIDVDAETLRVLAAYKVARAELSFELAKADAFVFADDEGSLRSPDAITGRWDRRIRSRFSFVREGGLDAPTEPPTDRYALVRTAQRGPRDVRAASSPQTKNGAPRRSAILRFVREGGLDAQT
ncbi:MAG: hypothetical protein WA006_01600, partial [Rhodoglobus sp.]